MIFDNKEIVRLLEQYENRTKDIITERDNEIKQLIGDMIKDKKSKQGVEDKDATENDYGDIVHTTTWWDLQAKIEELTELKGRI